MSDIILGLVGLAALSVLVVIVDRYTQKRGGWD